jgi:thiamine kinase-like enzyme
MSVPAHRPVFSLCCDRIFSRLAIALVAGSRQRDRTRATEAADSVIAVADSIQPTKHIHPIPPPSVHDATSSSNPTGAHASNDEPEAKGNQAVLEEAAVLALVRSDFPLWRDSPTLQELDASRFHVRPLTGGSSNTLWLLSLHAPAPDTLEPETPAALVVRFYGASTGAFVERDVEALVADLLSSGGVGARIFHHFTPTPASAASASASSSKPVLPHPAGRIEQFIAGRTLLHDELLIDSIGTGIAAELAKLHVIPVPSEGEYAAIPRHPQLFVNAWKWMQLACHARLKLPREGRSSVKTSLDDVYSLEYGHRLYESFGMPSFDPSVWTSSKISSLPFSPSSLSQLPPEFGQNRWVRELQWMQELLDNWNASGTTNKRAGGGTLKLTKAQSQRATDAAIFSQIGLCHNDLNPANILYVEPSSDPSEEEDAPSAFAPPPFTLIDFEYATFNPPSYDLANHFCEYALDYTLKGWPFFESKHAGFFMAQEKMIDRLRAYAEEKSKHMVSGAQAQLPRVCAQRAARPGEHCAISVKFTGADVKFAFAHPPSMYLRLLSGRLPLSHSLSSLPSLPVHSHLLPRFQLTVGTLVGHTELHGGV